MTTKKEKEKKSKGNAMQCNVEGEHGIDPEVERLNFVTRQSKIVNWNRRKEKKMRYK